MIRVVVGEDHAPFRLALARALAADGDIVVAGAAGDGREALALIGEHRPDVAVLDAVMPGLDGPGVARQLRAGGDGTPVLIATGSQDVERLREALAAGAAGYLSKTVEPAELRDAVRALAAGQVVLSPRMHAALALAVAGGADLSRDELHVLQRTADGRDDAQIGRSLGLDETAVRAQREAALARLGMPDAAAAAARAARGEPA